MLGVWEYDFSTSDWGGTAPSVASTWLYYGGFHPFLNSTVAPVSTSSGTSVASTWQYFGGFHVFSNSPIAQGSTWQYYGGFHLFADGHTTAATSSGGQGSTWTYYGGFHIFGGAPTTSTSTGAAVVTAGRRLISPTGFKTAATVVRF